jgi:hypothetical protein
VATLVERRVVGVARDALDLDAGEAPPHLPHLAIDLRLERPELALGLAAAEHAARAVVHRAARPGRAREREQDGRARVHRAGDEARVAGVGPRRTHQVGVPGGERARRALPVHVPTARAAVGQEQGLVLDEVVADLEVRRERGAEDRVRRVAEGLDDRPPVGDRVVGGGVVVRPVGLAERLVGVEPGLLAPVVGEAAQRRARVEVVVGGLPTIPT